jgi:hypothetical protein
MLLVEHGGASSLVALYFLRVVLTRGRGPVASLVLFVTHHEGSYRLARASVGNRRRSGASTSPSFAAQLKNWRT